jgi:hypothetical protein
MVSHYKIPSSLIGRTVKNLIKKYHTRSNANKLCHRRSGDFFFFLFIEQKSTESFRCEINLGTASLLTERFRFISSAKDIKEAMSPFVVLQNSKTFVVVHFGVERSRFYRCTPPLCRISTITEQNILKEINLFFRQFVFTNAYMKQADFFTLSG